MFTILGLSLLICLYSRPIAQRLGVMDHPSTAQGGWKSHKQATPLTGGLAIVPAAILGLSSISADYPTVAYIGACALFSLALGLLDDRHHISPVWRLGLSAFIIAFTLLSQPQLLLSFLHMSFLPQPVFLGAIALPFTLLCLLGLQNAVNMADGKNGVVLGMALVWSALFAYYAGPDLRPALLLLCFAILITLIFNLRGRLFLGDSGSYSLSILIGLLSLFLANSRFDMIYGDQVAVWFLWPVLDCLRVIASRVLAGQGAFTPDSNHMHHRIARLTRNWTMGLLVYHLCFAGPILLTLLWPEASGIVFLGSMALYILIYGLTARQREQLATA